MTRDDLARIFASLPWFVLVTATLMTIFWLLTAHESVSVWSELTTVLANQSFIRKVIVVVLASGIVLLAIGCVFIGTLSSLYSVYGLYAWSIQYYGGWFSSSLSHAEWGMVESAFAMMPLVSAVPAALYGAVRAGLSLALGLVGTPRPKLRRLPLSVFLVLMISLPGVAALGFDTFALFFLH